MASAIRARGSYKDGVKRDPAWLQGRGGAAAGRRAGCGGGAWVAGAPPPPTTISLHDLAGIPDRATYLAGWWQAHCSCGFAGSWVTDLVTKSGWGAPSSSPRDQGVTGARPRGVESGAVPQRPQGWTTWPILVTIVHLASSFPKGRATVTDQAYSAEQVLSSSARSARATSGQTRNGPPRHASRVRSRAVPRDALG